MLKAHVSRHALHYPLLLILLIVGHVPDQPLFAQAKPEPGAIGTSNLKLRELGRIARERAAKEALKRSSLDREIGTFVVTNAPLYYVVYSLNALGVRVCHEAVDADHDSYVDSDGVAAFAADKHISVALNDVTVRKILDHICAKDPRYIWTEDAASGFVVLAPREHSLLGFPVGPVKDKGNPVEVLERLDRRSETPLAPLVIKGHDLPDIQIDSPRCSATELLNQIVAQHPGMTWGFGGRASFNYVRTTTADAVRIEFPSLTKGKPVNLEWKYDVAERSIDGVSTVTVEKRRTARAVTRTTAAQVPVGGEAPPALRQNDGRAQEQNVVASRLAGSWTIETTLNERLTGKLTGARTTLVVSVDPAVEKKIPARFMKELKDELPETQIYLAGNIEIDGAKHPFILTAIHGNPHLFYFRERGGDPFGDSESFNLALAPSHNNDNDLLFVGGDFNNQPFRAYSRVAIEKKGE